MEIILSDDDDNEVYCELCGGEDLACLLEGEWLNDKIISAYVSLMLKATSEQGNTAVLSSYFMQKLMESGCDSVTHWYSKINLFEYEQLLCIINHNRNHWTLMVIDNKQREMVYYDSQSGTGVMYADALRSYLSTMSVRKGVAFDWNEWNFFNKGDIPQQENGSDCGIFMLQYIRCIQLNEPMSFNQNSILQIRKRIAKELESACLFTDVQGSVPETEQLSTAPLYLPSPLHQSAASDTEYSAKLDDESSIKTDLEIDSNSLTEQFSESDIDCESDIDSDLSEDPKPRCKLRTELKAVLPAGESYTYLVESYKKLPQSEFCGAPVISFEADLRVNLENEMQARTWLTEMSEQCKCTYRVTRTYKPSLKRVLFKVDLHCQHFRKPLTPKQLAVKKTNKSQTMLSGVKCKKTQCPSTLKITIQKPPKGKSPKHFDTHKALIKLVFDHNHPIESADALKFRPVAEETKKEFIRLFSLGHSASSAHHYYEEEVLAEKGQTAIADSALNPGVHWAHRFYRIWRVKTLGADNGKDLLDRLEQEVNEYNDRCNSAGGKAKLQQFCFNTDDSDSEDEAQPQKPKKRRKSAYAQPLILSLCTPLMARVHENILQSAELIFCDSTASLDRFNTSLFIVSTAHPAGGLPLGVMLTSDEKEETITKGLQMLLDTLPTGAFHHRGGKNGPLLVMTDDSNTEKQALKAIWPDSQQLLCTFHFLQRRWTWLFDSHNKIQHTDRTILLNTVKAMVYAKTVSEMEQKYKEFKAHLTVQKYPAFVQHISNLWPRRDEWALCYRSGLPVRGNNTNNVSEAGVRILKEIVFSRVKAYNLVEMFQFVTEKLESYYQCKLLSVAHNRLDHYIQARFRGVNAGKISKEHIKAIEGEKEQFSVKSRRDPDAEYRVDMALGTCTCICASDGSPCSHQLAVAIHYRIASLNCLSTLHPSCRQKLAYIALGNKANSDISFYSSVTQLFDEQTNTTTGSPLPEYDFNTPAWARIMEGAKDTETHGEEIDVHTDDSNPSIDDLSLELDKLVADLKEKIRENDPQLRDGVQKFVNRYNKMKCSHTTAMMASSFHCFGSLMGGTITSVQGGGIRRGRRIPVQATAAGRRKSIGKKGKAAIPAGRPPIGKKVSQSAQKLSRYHLPIRNKPKGKRPHNFAKSVGAGIQNAGKW